MHGNLKLKSGKVIFCCTSLALSIAAKKYRLYFEVIQIVKTFDQEPYSVGTTL